MRYDTVNVGETDKDNEKSSSDVRLTLLRNKNANIYLKKITPFDAIRIETKFSASFPIKML